MRRIACVASLIVAGAAAPAAARVVETPLVITCYNSLPAALLEAGGHHKYVLHQAGNAWKTEPMGDATDRERNGADSPGVRLAEDGTLAIGQDTADTVGYDTVVALFHDAATAPFLAVSTRRVQGGTGVERHFASLFRRTGTRWVAITLANPPWSRFCDTTVDLAGCDTETRRIPHVRWTFQPRSGLAIAELSVSYLPPMLTEADRPQVEALAAANRYRLVYRWDAGRAVFVFREREGRE